jgi:non-specific protein-tyrosine kinase
VQLSGFVPVVKRWWWLLAVSTVVAGLAGYTVAAGKEPRYEARVQLLVGPVNADLDTIRAAAQNAQTYAQLATAGFLLDETARELGLSLAATEVSASANDVTRFLTVLVVDRDPQRAAQVANTLAENLEALSAAAGQSRPEGELAVIDRAETPDDAKREDALLLAFLAGLAGFLGSLSLVFVVEYLRPAVRSGTELAQLSGVGAVATVGGGWRGGGRRQGLVVEAAPDSQAAAAYRLLATEIELSGREQGLRSLLPSQEQGLRSLLVVGAQGGEGAGEVAANLASALAAGGRRVTLVDANLGEGEITALLGLDERLGVGELLEHPGLLERGEDVLEQVGVIHRPGLTVLPCGLAGEEAAELERVRRLLDELLARGDLAVVNAAPLPSSSTALVWARAADATVLVARRDRTRRDAVTQAVTSLSHVHAKLVGAVLSGPPARPLPRGRRWAEFAPREEEQAGRPAA